MFKLKCLNTHERTKMIKRNLFLIFIFGGLLYGCHSHKGSKNEINSWAETIATIISDPNPIDGTYDYIIKYEASESTAINKEGKKISGIIEQFGLSQKRPLNNQKLRLRYMIEEPIIFEFIETIKFE